MENNQWLKKENTGKERNRIIWEIRSQREKQ